MPDSLSRIQLTGSAFDGSITLRTSLSSVETTLASANFSADTYALPTLRPQTTYIVTFSTSGTKICPGRFASADIGSFTTQ